MITLCQCNIHDGGRWSGRHLGRVTYDTAARFAGWVASVNPEGAPFPPISLIGMQELLGEDDRAALGGLLRRETRAEWVSCRTAQGIDGASGIGMFWRPGLIETADEWSLGEFVLDTLDNGYVLEFTGRVFREVDTGETLALFTGKLVWDGASLDGAPVTEETRVRQAARLKAWISDVTSRFPGVPRAIATDLNSDVGTPTWQEMSAGYTDPSSERTASSFQPEWSMNRLGRRLDYIWLSDEAAFVDGPHRSPHFGSDHRAVYATIQVSDAPVS